MDRHVRNPGLVRLGHGVRRVEFVAGGVVGDGAGDASGLGAGERAHAPVDGARQPDDRQEVEVDGRAEHRGRGRLVVRLVGDAGRLVAGVERLEDQPLGHRVGLLDVVVAVVVGGHGVRPLIHQGVVAFLDRDGEPRHAGLAGVALAVSVGVEEHGAAHLVEPPDQDLVADVDLLAAAHGDVERVEDRLLWRVPEGQLIVAVGHVGDVERPVGAAAGQVHHLVVAAEVAQRHPGTGDRSGDAGTGHACGGQRHAALAADVGVGQHRATDDLAGVAPVEQRFRSDEAEVDVGNLLAADALLGVVAGVALLHPDVPVPVTFQGGGLRPGLSGGRNDLGGVPVGPEVLDGDIAVGVGDAFAGRPRRDPRLAVVEDDGPGGVSGVRSSVHVPGAERVAVVVHGHLAQHVRQVGGEAGQPAFRADLVGAVDRNRVVEDAQPDGAQWERVRLHRHRHVGALGTRDLKVRTVDLVTVRGHRDQVLTDRQLVEGLAAVQIALVTLSDDRDSARGVADRRPLAFVGEVRGAGDSCPRWQTVLHGIVRVADIVGGDEPSVAGHRIVLLDLWLGANSSRADHVQRDAALGRCGGSGRSPCRRHIGGQW